MSSTRYKRVACIMFYHGASDDSVYSPAWVQTPVLLHGVECDADMLYNDGGWLQGGGQPPLADRCRGQSQAAAMGQKVMPDGIRSVEPLEATKGQLERNFKTIGLRKKTFNEQKLRNYDYQFELTRKQRRKELAAEAAKAAEEA